MSVDSLCFKRDADLEKLREMVWNGKNTLAMIYDSFPVIDYFRSVNSDTVMGVMDNKTLRDAGLYYFYLTRA